MTFDPCHSFRNKVHVTQRHALLNTPLPGTEGTAVCETRLNITELKISVTNVCLKV